jgi:hypothetical protein
MPKAKKKFKLSRTIDGITYVNSKAYQPHTRAERGTYTPISLADGMKKSSVVQTQANLMAKIVFDAVNEFAPNFKDGKFWSRLVSLFRFFVKEKSYNGYKLLEGMEVRPDYPMSKHGSFALKDTGDTIEFSYSLKIASDYRLSILRIATDQHMLVPYPDDVVIMDIGENEMEGGALLHFAPLADEAQILYVMKCEQLVNGKVEGLLSQKSVRFLKCS